jgi:hypothetical protein
MNNTLNENLLNLYLETALERHRIYVKKESGERPPWTEDVIFQKYFFCNLFRQLDKCSKWIIDNILPLDRWDLVILYRFLSTYELFEEIKKENKLTNIEWIYSLLEHKHSFRKRLFNRCFIRNPNSSIGNVQTYRVPFILIEDLKNEGVNKEFISNFETLESLCKYLRQFKGIGPFMAYEYACDFEYTDYFNPTDKYTWANMGPGAMRGMSLVLHAQEDIKMKQQHWLIYARQLLPMLQEKIHSVYPNEDVTMREVEHELCEFQKYIKYWQSENYNRKVAHRKYVPYKY